MLKIMIASGKGGVGKTTTALEIARKLTELGYKVGIIDCDIDCPNIVNLLNIKYFTGFFQKPVKTVQIFTSFFSQYPYVY